MHLRTHMLAVMAATSIASAASSGDGRSGGGTRTWCPCGGFTSAYCFHSTSVPGKMRMRSCFLASLQRAQGTAGKAQRVSS